MKDEENNKIVWLLEQTISPAFGVCLSWMIPTEYFFLLYKEAEPKAGKRKKEGAGESPAKKVKTAQPVNGKDEVGMHSAHNTH